MSKHKGIWRTSCCGEKDYAAQKRIDDLENALAVAVKNDGSGAVIDCDELGGAVINWYLARMAKFDWMEE